MSDANTHTPLHALSDAVAQLVAGAASRIVSVASHGSRASGFIWRPGLVVTAEETLAEDGEISLTLPGGQVVAASLAGRDPSTDIALLRAEGAASIAPIPARTAAPDPGSLAVTVGARDGKPVALLGMVAHVSGPWQSLRGGEIDSRIELDQRLSTRAEGGLVLDAGGQALGMAVLGPRRRVLVIPAATIERVAARLEAKGRIARGYLGLGAQTVAIDGGADSGVMVMSVDPGGPAAAAGLHQGDVITAMNGEPVKHMRALIRSTGPDSVGRPVSLTVRRGGTAQTMALTIGERPEA